MYRRYMSISPQLMNANVRDAGVEEDPTLVVKDISSAHLRLMMQGHHSIEKIVLNCIEGLSLKLAEDSFSYATREIAPIQGFSQLWCPIIMARIVSTTT